jgi:DNA-binding ferritin-like protein
MKNDFDKQAERITALEKSVSDANEAAALKDTRITELQTEIANHTKLVDALKTQHKTEIDNLAGQLASAKAGKTKQMDAGGDQHEAANLKSKNGANLVVARSGALDNLLKIRN